MKVHTYNLALGRLKEETEFEAHLCDKRRLVSSEQETMSCAFYLVSEPQESTTNQKAGFIY